MMEQPIFSSPETKKMDIFDEYSLEPNYVLENINGLNVSAQTNYKRVDIGDRIVFVRTDVLTGIEKYVKELNPSEYKGL